MLKKYICNLFFKYKYYKLIFNLLKQYLIHKLQLCYKNSVLFEYSTILYLYILIFMEIH